MIQRIEKLEDLVFAENEENKGKFQSLDEAKIEFKTDVLMYKSDLQNHFDTNVSKMESHFNNMHANYEEKNVDNFDMFMENLKTAQLNRTNYKLELDETIARNSNNIQNIVDHQARLRERQSGVDQALDSLNKALQIQNIMNKQDEKDRSNMSLYAGMDAKASA